MATTTPTPTNTCLGQMKAGREPPRSPPVFAGEFISHAPNRCIIHVNGTNYNISRGRIIDIVQMRQYIAETSAKVMGHGAPSQPKLQLQCTVSFCYRRQRFGRFVRYIGHSVSAALRAAHAVSRHPFLQILCDIDTLSAECAGNRRAILRAVLSRRARPKVFGRRNQGWRQGHAESTTERAAVQG